MGEGWLDKSTSGETVPHPGRDAGARDPGGIERHLDQRLIDQAIDAARRRGLVTRPTTQRERLSWDQAAESIAVHLDETGWLPPAEPESIGDLLGPASTDPWERLEYERVASAVAGVLDPDPCVDQSLGIA